jgi:carboxyl-terminal processing protease
MAGKKYIFLFGLLFALACKKNIDGIPPPSSYGGTDFNQVFQAFWSGMNNNYVWWSEDSVNWDAKYNVYKKKFAALGGISASTTLAAATGYLREMTSGLIDSHYFISFDNPFISSIEVNPAVERKNGIIRPVLGDYYFIDNLGHMLDNNGQWGRQRYIDSTTIKGRTQFHYQLMVTGTIGGNIIYFHINRFNVSRTFDSMYIQSPWKYFQQLLDTPPAGLKGMIVDLRSNSGGLLSDLQFVFGKLISAPIVFGYTRQKSGIGRLDYTPWIPAEFTPRADGKTFGKPIVVLTDQNTVSMAEHSTMALKMLPGTYVIGDTTYGATGPLSSDSTLFNDRNLQNFHLMNICPIIRTPW